MARRVLNIIGGYFVRTAITTFSYILREDSTMGTPSYILREDGTRYLREESA